MITVPWWVLPALVFAGGFLGTLVAAILRARGDAMATVLAKVLAEAERPEPAPVEVSGPRSFQHLFDGLPPEPKLPDLPKHDWFRELTGPLAILAPPEPEAAAIVAEVVEDPKPRARTRFEGEPKPPAKPVEVEVCVVVDDEVRTEKVQVPA